MRADKHVAANSVVVPQINECVVTLHGSSGRPWVRSIHVDTTLHVIPRSTQKWNSYWNVDPWWQRPPPAGWWFLPYHENCFGMTRWKWLDAQSLQISWSQSEQSLRCVWKDRSMKASPHSLQSSEDLPPVPWSSTDWAVPAPHRLLDHIRTCGGKTDTMSTLSCSSNHPRVTVRG